MSKFRVIMENLGQQHKQMEVYAMSDSDAITRAFSALHDRNSWFVNRVVMLPAGL